jgi:hypothetical protein
VVIPILLIAAIVAAGCSTGSSGDAGSSSAASGSGLDTGTYATTPRPAFRDATTAGIVYAVESQRMADYVTLPQEIDPLLDIGFFPGRPWSALINQRSIDKLFESEENSDIGNAAIDNALVGGMFTGARSRGTADGQAGPSLQHGVMRFSTPADAVKAAQAMADKYRSAPTSTAPTRQTMASVPTTTVFRTDITSSSRSWIAMTTYQVYVIVDQLYESSTDAERLFRRSLDLQIPLIDRFPRTTSRNGAARIPRDENKILVYTLANPKPVSGLNDGVYGPRGIAGQYNDQVALMNQLQDAGAEHTAVAGTNVFRAATPAKATTLQKQLAATFVLSGAADDPSGAPGVPESACLSTEFFHLCYVTVGRYIGEAVQNDVTAAHQQIAAQYRILQQADQNAN